MPKYNYKCDNCELEVIIQHGMNESPQVDCEHCGEIMRKKISVMPRTLFKGEWETRDIMETHD